MSFVAAKCTQCGANIEVDDTHDAGICKFCGTPFVTEKVINNFNSYTVNYNNFSGANITINNSVDINHLYQTARRFKNDANYAEAAKYYDKILIEDPNSWEAYFYTTYNKAIPQNKSQIQESAMSIVICLDTVLKMIKDHERTDNGKIKALNEVSSSCIKMADYLHNFLLSSDNDDVALASMPSHIKSVAIVCVYIAMIGYMVGDKIQQEFPSLFDQNKSTIMEAWKQGVNFHIDCLGYLPNRDEGVNVIQGYIDKIKTIDSNYNVSLPSVSTSGGCYIATCVYGSYDCPQVWTLRRFRDNFLAKTWYGRAFILTYYKISPKLVKWFGQTKWFRRVWKSNLDCMVARLKAKGIKDTPYEDKN